MTEAERQIEAYKAVRSRLWGHGQAVNIIEDIRRASEIEEANKARNRREAELRIAKYRIEQERVAAKHKADIAAANAKRQAEIAARRLALLELKQAKQHEIEAVAELPDWSVIGPMLTGGSIEEITSQVLAHFPSVTFEFAIEKVKTRRRAHILRILCTAIRVQAPHITLMEIGRFLKRDHSTVVAYLRKTHLGYNAVKRQKMSKIKPHTETVKQMFFVGASHSSIARHIGSAQSAVTRFIHRQGWERA
jgi:hypothetical protein